MRLYPKSSLALLAALVLLCGAPPQLEMSQAATAKQSEGAPARRPSGIHQKVRHSRAPVTRHVGYPGHPPDCPGLPAYNPANPDRGFCDPGFAYHGNISGCAIDLGYGRWEPCDVGQSQ